MNPFLDTPDPEFDPYTLALHGGADASGDGDRPLVPPIAQTTAFAQSGLGDAGRHAYSRVSNPTVSALESALAAFSAADAVVAFSTGLAAETALFLALLQPGDRVVVSDVVYGGTLRLLRRLFVPRGVAIECVDASDLAAVELALARPARLLFVETPANPTLKLCDVAALARLAHAAGALLAVDNTFLTPALQRVFDLGADVEVLSTTKFVEGHSGALGGTIGCRDAGLVDALRFVRKATGSIQSPFDAWLTLRGLRTLPLRIERQSRTAAIVAAALEGDAAVTRVLHPSLARGDDAALARRQHRGGLHGAIVALELEDEAAVRRFLAELRLCTLAEHCGAERTLVTHSASMTHADVPATERAALGIADGLVRVSVGLEDPAAIVADLRAGLAPLAAEARASAREVARA